MRALVFVPIKEKGKDESVKGVSPSHSIQVGTEHTKSEKSVTMYLHSAKQITELKARYGFEPMRNLSLRVFMDRERTKSMSARSYLAMKRTGIEPVISPDR